MPDETFNREPMQYPDPDREASAAFSTLLVDWRSFCQAQPKRVYEQLLLPRSVPQAESTRRCGLQPKKHAMKFIQHP